MTKYRARRKDTGEEIKGHYFKAGNKHYITLNNAEVTEYGVDGEMLYGFVEVVPETISFYTTIDDRNGTEIYGSIFIDGKMTKGGDKIQGTIDGEECEWDVVWETDDILGWSIDSTNEPLEVIGNQE